MSESPSSEEKAKPKPERQPSPTPRRSRLRKWIHRFFLSLVVLFIVAVIVLFSARAYFRYTGLRDLDAEMAQLDAEDPGWRWDDLQAAREKAAPPDAQNSAVIVREVRAMIPKEWDEWMKRPKELGATEVEPLPLNRFQLLEELARDEELFNSTRKARDHALKLRGYPRGYHVNVVNDTPFFPLEETQGAREVMNLLKLDAILGGQDRNPVRGLQAAHAILNTARSIGDEPTLISTLVRFAGGFIAVESTMRVLALTDSNDSPEELARLQTAILAEADAPILLDGFRGERAIYNRFFEGLSNGTVTSDQLMKMGGEKPSPETRIFFYFQRGFLPEDQRRYLHLMSELISAVKNGSAVEPLATEKKIEAELKANRSIRYPFHRLLLPAATKVLEAGLRHRAELLSAATLIACERFRLTRGRWPESLAELPKDLLPAIPIDPFTGKPMKFAKLPDGIAVYSLPPKEMPGLDKRRLTNPLGGTELGWRLYDPKQRGLPPLPKPKKEMPEDEPMP